MPARLLKWPLNADLRVGLLGGSFNPAHQGHRHISLVALHRLGLDQVWWLVAPQNPLKPTEDTAPLEARLARACSVAAHPAIRVSDMERRLGTRYTADTLTRLRRIAPRTRFVWLMGADNLIQLPRWRSWTLIMESVPVAVIARPGYSLKARQALAAQRYQRFRIAAEHARALADCPPPAWTFIEDRPMAISSTELRARARGAGCTSA